MDTSQGLKNFFSMKTLALCFLLMILLAQGGEGSNCKIPRSIFLSRFINHQIYSLAKMAGENDFDTVTRFIGQDILENVNKEDRCYVMKEVLNFELKEVLLTFDKKYHQYMREVLPYLNDLRYKLNRCTLQGNPQTVKTIIDNLRTKVDKLGSHAVIKAMSEMDLMLLYLQKFCS
ncbi:interleukin-22 [Sminthopsis crassicaudata]|uniref:interleukin-22 n=1 Tax=Sminthopsis crassicaudata TaxID=9301 RepID=UPI003D690C21